jgi:hypothetical protein
MATKSSAHPQGFPEAAGGHEKTDASTWGVFAVAAGLVIAAIIVHFALAGYLGHLQKRPSPTDQWHRADRSQKVEANPVPFPRLQVSPAEDLSEFRAREEAALKSYGWVNRTSGVVRIPVAKAMELVLQKGLPTRQATNSSKGGPSRYQLMLDRNRAAEPGRSGQ